MFSLLLLLNGCQSDHSLVAVPPVVEPIAPDIELSIEESTVPVTCEVITNFTISNVGNTTLEVSNISIMMSYPAESSLVTMPELPISIVIDDFEVVSMLTVDEDSVDDVISISVASNDPDEPISSIEETIRVNVGQHVTENHEIESQQQVDILLVIDNSCSMAADQAGLSQGAFDAISALEASVVDYRIGVITTDNPDFVGSPVIYTSPDPYSDLQGQVIVGIAGSANERGVQMSIDATSSGGDAEPGGSFLRDDAKLGIVWVSDENDFSSGTLTDWTNHFWGLKLAPSLVTAWAIVSPDITTCPGTDPGLDYIDLAAVLGGGNNSICQDQWADAFLGLGAAMAPNPIIYLNGNPIPNTLDVYVDGVQTVYGWVYVVDANAIAFDPGSIPDIGTPVDVIYDERVDCE